FLTGMRHASEFDRVLATVLFAQVSDSGDLPDEQRSDLLSRYQAFVKKEVEIFKGRTMQVTSARFLATFDGPARAIRAACAISDFARRLGIQLKAGLHTGECEYEGGQVRCLAVEIANQVASQSSAGQVLVSSTVKDLVAGSGIRFNEVGVHELRQNLGEIK